MKKLILFLVPLLISSIVSAQFVVNTTATANTMISNLIGVNVTASNPVLNGAPASARGTFTCTGGCNLGFSSGIILTSGSATIATTANTGTGQGAGFPTSQTDANLATLATGPIYDACVLEFDFWVASDKMKFNYIFGSDEYNDYVNSPYNDVFGFFISGPGITPSPKNIAIVPGTMNTPVAINNVNNGGPVAWGVPPPGPCTNCAYFRNNNAPVMYSTAWDGLTTTLQAESTVCPCETYHIKLAVSDVNDQVFDSGVLLEQNSFQSIGQAAIYINGVEQPPNQIIYLCSGQSVDLCVLDNITCTNNLNYSWNGGLSGNTQCINVNQGNLAPNGNYTCVITHNINTACFVWTSSVKVIYVDPPTSPTITPSGSTVICPGGSVNLTAGPSGVNYTYLWSDGSNTQTITASTPGTYSVTISNSCGSTTTSIAVTAGSAPASITGITAICSGQNTTLTANSGQSYLWSNGQTTQSITVNTAGTYAVTVTQAGGCSASASVNVVVDASPSPVITGALDICVGISTVLDAGPGFTSYQWSNGFSSQMLNVTTPGIYTVTVTNSSGCTGSTSVTVNQSPTPNPVITGNLSFCQGGSSTLNAGSGYSSYTWSTGAATPSINVSTAGTYTVTVTNSFNCFSSTSVTVSVGTGPSPVITGVTAFCSGGNTTLTAPAGFTSYQWSNGTSGQSINVNQSGTFTVTVTDLNGCSGTASVSTTVNPLPTPVISGVTSICQNATTTFDAGAGYASYQWSNSASGQTISTGTAGTYSVTVTDANGCTGSASINLTVNPLPTPSISGNTVFCLGNSSTLNAGSGYTSYLWNGGTTSQTLNVFASGAYTVTVTNNFGCSQSASVNVTVNINPSPVITGALGFCTGSNTTLTAPAGFTSYQWSNGTSGQSINVNQSGTFTVTVTDLNGCSGTASVSTTVNPLPTPVISGVTSICQNATTTFDAGAGYASYQWSNSASGQTISTGTAGTYSVTVTDANGCTGSASINLSVNPLPTPSISGNTVFCLGDNTTLSANSGFVSYLWSDGSNTQTLTTGVAGSYIVTVTDANGCTNTTSATVIVNPLPSPLISGPNSICDGDSSILDAGNYSSYLWSTGSTMPSISISSAGIYTVTVTDTNGCIGTSPNFTLTVNPLPTAIISHDTSICKGQSAAILLNFTGSSPFNFVYSNGSQAFSGSSTNNLISLTLSPESTSTYTLVSITDANCAGSVSGSALISVKPVPSPAISGNNIICNGDTSMFTVGPFNSYLWSNGATTQQISVSAAANYVVTVTASNGCTASASLALIVNPTPIAAFTNDTSLTCDRPFINFFNYSIYPPGSHFLWEFGDGAQSNQISPSHVYNDPGSYQVTLKITTSNGCIGRVQQLVVIDFFPFPVADFVTDKKEVSITNSTISMIDQSQHAVAWLWDFGDGMGSEERNPSHSFADYGKFIIKQTVANIAGCRDSYEEEVFVTPFFVPNAFTPNNDGMNDYFFSIPYEMNLNAYKMSIWNRWGQKVFETDNPNSQWNGNFQTDNPAPDGVYIYQIKFRNQSNKDFTFEGRVSLIR